MGCALPRLALHGGHDNGQRLSGLRGGLGAEGAAGGGVRVMGVVYRHTANHVGPLTRSRAAGEDKRVNKHFSKIKPQIKIGPDRICRRVF